MSTPAFPYETRLNVPHGALELIDVGQLVDDCKFPTIVSTWDLPG